MDLTDDQQQPLERLRAHLRELPERMHRKQALNAEHAEAEAVLAQVLGLVEPPWTPSCVRERSSLV